MARSRICGRWRGSHTERPRVSGAYRRIGHQSEELPRIWRLHDVRSLSAGNKLFDHPKVGRLELNYEILDISGTQQRLVVYRAVPGTPDCDAMQLLNMLDSPAEKPASFPRTGSVDADAIPRTI